MLCYNILNSLPVYSFSNLIDALSQSSASATASDKASAIIYFRHLHCIDHILIQDER